MPYVIQHPARVDLFDNGEREWGPLSQARHFTDELEAWSECEAGDVVTRAPEKQPIHPITQTP
jgi:hypothetical protein